MRRPIQISAPTDECVFVLLDDGHIWEANWKYPEWEWIVEFPPLPQDAGESPSVVAAERDQLRAEVATLTQQVRQLARWSKPPTGKNMPHAAREQLREANDDRD